MYILYFVVSFLDCSMCVLRLTGYSNWSDVDITVYVTDDRRVERDAVRCAISKHISDLVVAVFLNSRPSTPAQSRWTGVASTAQFAYGLYCFHRLLATLCGALLPSGVDVGGKAGGKPGKGKGKGGKGGKAKGGRGRGLGHGNEADLDIDVPFLDQSSKYFFVSKL